jgi:hypothetical protein
MRHARPLLLALAVALLAVACDRGGDQPEVSPTAEATQAAATPSATAAAEVTTSPTPPAGPTPLPGSIEVPSTAVLIDVRTGTATTLYRDAKQAAYSATFEGDEILLNAGQVLRFRLDGTRATSTPTPRDSCRNVNGAAEVGGRSYAGVRCGSISPDQRWMTYSVQNGEAEVGTTGYRVRLDDLWAVDLQTSTTRRLQSGLMDCGGCDARYGPRWSPSSRYVAYAEFGGQGRRFLSDLTTGTTRQIANGNEITDAPVWAPSSDLLVYSTTSHGTGARFEDLAARTARDLAVAWPVRFDARGTYLYSPAWASAPKSGPSTISTTIIEVATGDSLGVLQGAPPPEFLWTGATAVTRSGDGYLAVLQQAGPCAGTAVYRQGVAQPLCIVGGVQGHSAPNGRRVAVARETGQVGPIHGPGFSSMSMPRYDIDVVDVASGASRTVVTGAISFTPPLMLWNAAGTHLLVLWPQAGGL